MKPLRIALAQTAPHLGLFDENLERHHTLLADARAGGAGLVVFPELGLTGYQLLALVMIPLFAFLWKRDQEVYG